MWIGYIVVTSLYARAFSEYAFTLLPQGISEIYHYLFASGIVILFIILNFLGARAVGRTELIIVAVKVALLIFFSVLGLFFLEPSRLTSLSSSGHGNILIVMGLVFLSYEGFGLVANTAEDIREPKKNLPKALYGAIIVVMVIYVLTSLVIVGTLSIEEIINAKEYVLAEAVRPILGSSGFTLMVIAALFSTASAINATIYGPVYMVHETARAKQLPEILDKPILGRDSGTALLTTGILILFFANVFTLEAIAELGSLSFLIIYISVNIAHLRLTHKTGGNLIIIYSAVVGCLIAFLMLAYYVFLHSPITFVVFMVVIALCFAFQVLFQRYNQ